MKNALQSWMIFIIISLILAGCGSSLPAVQAAPVPVLQVDKHLQASTQAPIFYVPPADATATPTPFRPIPPTPLGGPVATSPVQPPAATPTAEQVAVAPQASPTLAPVSPPAESPIPLEPPTIVPTFAAPAVAPAEAPAAPASGKHNRQANGQPAGQMNIILLGSDQRPGDVLFRTDTIVLATLNKDLGTVNLTSFPRDLYVNLPGWGSDRINTAWERGGFKMLGDTFQANLGVRPDHYVLIDFSSFKRVMESVGGLDVNVGVTVSDYREGRWYTVQAGKQHMNGDDILWYVRTRKTSNDFARTRRQQEVLQALIEKMLTLDTIRRTPELYEIYKSSVTTDITLADILPWLPLGVKCTDISRIHHYFIGPEQATDWTTYEGAMVLLPRMDAIQAVMRKALNIDQ